MPNNHPSRLKFLDRVNFFGQAVELDAKLARYLRRELGGVPAFELLEADALEVHPRECFPGQPFKLVANIPYHITSPLLHSFLEGDRPPELSVLLVQLEVAERVASPPGGMSYLSVFVQNVTDAEIVARVPAAAFEPAPKVDSAVLRLRRRAQPPVPPGEGRDVFYRVVQAAFRQRRKQVHNGLTRELPVPREAVEALNVGRPVVLGKGHLAESIRRMAADLGGVPKQSSPRPAHAYSSPRRRLRPVRQHRCLPRAAAGRARHRGHRRANAASGPPTSQR